MTGAELPVDFEMKRLEPAGDRWDFDDEREMQRRLPRLYRHVRARHR